MANNYELIIIIIVMRELKKKKKSSLDIKAVLMYDKNWTAIKVSEPNEAHILLIWDNKFMQNESSCPNVIHCV